MIALIKSILYRTIPIYWQARAVPFLAHLLCHRTDFTCIVQKVSEKKFFRAEASAIESILDGCQLIYFDVGSSGGMERGLQQYEHLFRNILAEPRDDEGAIQGESSSILIPKLISDEVGDSALNVSKAEALSSTLTVNPYFANFWSSGNLHRFDVTERKIVASTTIETVLNETVGRCDYLKIDTQGTELNVLMGLGEYRPIIIKSEISFVPLYKDQTIFFDLAKHLYDIGYLLFHLAYRSKSTVKVARGRKPWQNTVLPLHGDAWFMPDWTRKNGQDIINGREKEYEALMMMFGMGEIAEESLSYVKSGT